MMYLRYARPLLAALVAIAAGVLVWSLWTRTPGPLAEPAAESGRVRVVNASRPAGGAPAAARGPALPAVAGAMPAESDVKALEAAAIRAFPMLYAVRIACEPDCVLIATLGPDATTGDWPPSQWPYKGNLERFLTARGYMPRGPLAVDQPGDNDTLLRVPITLP